jgi:integrase/recombinase XerD
MRSDLFVSRQRIFPVRDGPAVAVFAGFTEALSQMGYAARVARGHVRAAEHFVDWTNRRGLQLCESNHAALARFDRHISRCRCPQYGPVNRSRVVPGARLFLRYLCDARIINEFAVRPAPDDPVLLTAFNQWMRHQRGVCEATITRYRPDICELLTRVGTDPSRVDAGVLRTLFLEQNRISGSAAVQTCAKALRMFVRFLIAEGYCAVGLDAAIPTVAHWRLTTLPRYLPPTDVNRLLDSCNRASPVGRRNRAILLLLARLGLRAGDIAQLQLSDIDWKGARIHVCGKGGCHTPLPLTQEVGEAIVEYLQHGRPQVKTQTLFVGCRAPFRPFGSCCVSIMVARALYQAGVARPSRGAAHLLRHSVATSLLRQGASLQDIGTLLRHRSIDTTQIYAKVAVEELREIAQPWPEVQPC